MKQHITREQLDELSSEQKIKLYCIVADVERRILQNEIMSANAYLVSFFQEIFTVGRMIEILDNQVYSSNSPIDFILTDLTYDCIDGFLVMVVGYINSAVGHEVLFSLKTYKYNRCDALWEAIKVALQ